MSERRKTDLFEPEARPIVVSENRRWTLTSTILVSIIVVTGGCVLGYARLLAAEAAQQVDTDGLREAQKDHEARIRQLELMNARIDANLQYIRDQIERRQASRPGP